MNFKVGDRVRRNSYQAIGSVMPEGTEGVVESIHPDGNIVRVNNLALFALKFDLIEPIIVKPAVVIPLTVKPKECPCGIYRGDCDYHRD